MKLNYDCVRDILLVLEEDLQIDSSDELPALSLEKVAGKLADKYSRADVIYNTQMLADANYINARIEISGNNSVSYIRYKNITFAGHQFLDTVRPQKVWDKAKEIVLKQVGNLTIQGLMLVASDLIPKFLSNLPF